MMFLSWMKVKIIVFTLFVVIPVWFLVLFIQKLNSCLKNLVPFLLSYFKCHYLNTVQNHIIFRSHMESIWCSILNFRLTLTEVVFDMCRVGYQWGMQTRFIWLPYKNKCSINCSLWTRFNNAIFVLDEYFSMTMPFSTNSVIPAQ